MLGKSFDVKVFGFLLSGTGQYARMFTIWLNQLDKWDIDCRGLHSGDTIHSQLSVNILDPRLSKFTWRRRLIWASRTEHCRFTMHDAILSH